MKKITLSSVMVLFLTVITAFNLQAAYLKDVPRIVIQPNGDTLHCFASGDEFYNYLHDVNHYTIIQNKQTGYYVYATKIDGQIVPSSFIPGIDQPEVVGLKPGIMISPEEWSSKREAFLSQVPPKPSKSANSVAEQNHGRINNLVVFIRFAGDTNLTTGFSTVNNMFNDSTASAISMYNYFKSTSYNQLFINSSFYPAPSGNTILSYQDIYERNYYLPYSSSNTTGYNGDSERTSREHSLLQRAVNFIASSVPTSLNIDYDSDGYVDNVCFVVKGNVGDWSDLLWPHRWSLYSQSVYINSKRVYDYNFMLEGSTSYFATRVLCHEMQHTLSFPDFYHYDDNTINPVGSWDLMCSTSNPPQNSGAFAKYKYGNWIDSIPLITTPGTYTLSPLATSPTGNAYKIASEQPGQFYVLEYRSTNSQFDSAIPGSGILIYKIDEDYQGNAGYNGTTVFDEVYVYRPNGTNTTNGNVSQAFYNATVGRTAFNSTTNPRPFFTDGSYSSLSITNITTAGTTISFTYNGLLPTIVSNSSQLEFSGNAPTGALPQSVSVTGLFLTDSITVTASSQFLVSRNNSVWYSTLKLPISGGLLYIKYSSTVVGSHTGTITLSSGTATPVVVNVTGTICDVISTFPFTEGFEGGQIPTCWAQTYVTGSVNWIYQNGGHDGGSSTNHPASAHTGTKNALFFHDSNNNYTTKLQLPVMNLNAISNPQLTFWRANPIWGGDIDILKVYYKTSASGNWVLLNTYSTNVDNWTLTTINLPNPSSTYYIAFEGKATYGYGVSIDDITVNGTAVNSQIVASSGANGTITPSGTITIPNGSNQTFTFTPNTNYMVDSVFVDNTYMGRFNSYTFTNVTSNHSIRVKFKQPNFDIVVVPDSLAFQTEITQPSESQFFMLSGVDLTDSISLIAPPNFELSINNSVWESNLLLPYFSPNPVYVRFNPITVGTFIDSIAIQSGNTHEKVKLRGVATNQIFTILSMCNAGGTIVPNGNIPVYEFDDQTFTITPDQGFVLSALYIDDQLVESQYTYTFTNVTNGHLIYAYFVDPTKVDENEAIQVFLYPNPVYNQLNINFLNSTISLVDQIQVFDPTGKLIETISIKNNNTIIDMSQYAQGIYFLKFYTDKGVVAKKIFKL